MHGGTTRLLAHAVTDKTALAYDKEVARFLNYIKLNRIPADSTEQFDMAMATYMDFQCFAEQKGVSVGAKLVAGINDLYPEIKGRLPLAARSLIAWQKMSVVGEGTPVPDFMVASLRWT